MSINAINPALPSYVGSRKKTTFLAIKPKHKVHLSAAALPVKGKKIEFIHVQQMHSVDDLKPNKDLYEAVIHSQLAVAKAIKAHPECPVLLEALYEDGAHDSAFPAIHRKVQEKFPTGFRYEFQELSYSQKKLIYSKGAPRILFFLGEIPGLYKTIHKEEGIAIDRQIAAGLTDGIFKPREEQAVLCVKEAAAKIDVSKFLVIFGSAHNFKPFCKREGFSHTAIDCRT
jgi:hypothetical protein